MDAFVLRGGLVCDGTGTPPRRADVLVEGDRVAQVGEVPSAVGLPQLDVSGKTITPGFVDLHRHCDLAVVRDPDFGRVELAQGITSTIAGNCGLAPVPLSPAKHKPFFDYLEPVTGKLPAGTSLDTESYSGYLASLQNAGLPLNMGILAGMGAVRYAVKGVDPAPLTAAEQDQAAGLIGQALDAGAYGVSLGIMYRPECYNTAQDYDALLRPLARADGVLCTHIRGEGDSLVDSVQEVIGIAKRAGVRLNISHFKATGIRNWNSTIYRAIDCIEQARAGGQPVTADFYPYDGGSTTLLSLLPPDLMERPADWFATAQGRQALRDSLYREHPGWDNMVTSIGWERILLSSIRSEAYRADQGSDFAAIARLHNFSDPADLMAELIAAEGGNVGIIVLSMAWEDVCAVARLPYTVLISDALYGGGGNPHPRLFGAFPRMLHKLVGEQGLLNFETALAKMTSMPAERIGLRDRGVLRPGAYADLLVFDPAAFLDTATYASPCHTADGLELAFVNGRPALDGSRAAGRVLRRL